MEEQSKLVDWLENKFIGSQNWNPFLNPPGCRHLSCPSKSQLIVPKIENNSRRRRMRRENEQRMEEESKLIDWLENKFINDQNPLLNPRNHVDTFHIKKEKFRK